MTSTPKVGDRVRVTYEGRVDRLGAESVVEGGKVGVWAPRPVRVMQRASADWQPVADEAA